MDDGADQRERGDCSRVQDQPRQGLITLCLMFLDLKSTLKQIGKVSQDWKKPVNHMAALWTNLDKLKNNNSGKIWIEDLSVLILE